MNQIISALLKAGYAVEFNSIDSNVMVTLLSQDDMCKAQAVGLTPNLTLTDLLEKAKKNKLDASLTKLATELLGAGT